MDGSARSTGKLRADSTRAEVASDAGARRSDTLSLICPRAGRDAAAWRHLTQLDPRLLRLLVVDAPLAAWGDERVAQAFNATVELKLQGFGTRYGQVVMPVDSTDFLATHVLSCLPFRGRHYAVAGYRVMDAVSCRRHHLAFPARSLTVCAEAPLHTRAVDEFLQRNPATSYIGAWTIHPCIRRGSPLRGALRQHFALGAVQVHARRGVSGLLVGATLRFGVDRLLREAGFRPLTLTGVRLPHLGVRHLDGERVELMGREGPAPEVSAGGSLFARAWNERIELGAAAGAEAMS